MNVNFQKTEDQLAVINVKVGPEDYIGEFKKELNKIKSKASFKGFRAGKVPASYVKKMYGKAILQDIVIKMVQEKINEHIETLDDKLIGYPISTDSSPTVTFDEMEEGEYEFELEVGLEPKFEIAGMDEATVIERYVVEPSDETVKSALTRMLKSNPTQINPETDIQEKDILELEIKQLDDDLVINKFSMPVDKIADDVVKQDLLGKDVGYTFECDIYKLEDVKEEFVHQHFLGLDPEDDAESLGRVFRTEVVGITRAVDAELNQAFYDKMFDEGDVTSEEEALQKIKTVIKESYAPQIKSLVERDLYNNLLETNNISLPEGFIFRWVKSKEENQDKEYTDDEKKEILKSIKWSIISNKIVEENEIKVEKEDLEASFKKQIQGMFRGYPMEDAMLDSLVPRMMSDEKAVSDTYNQLMTARIFELVENKVTVKDLPIDEEDFIAKIEALNEELSRNEKNALGEEE